MEKVTRNQCRDRESDQGLVRDGESNQGPVSDGESDQGPVRDVPVTGNQ